MEGTTMRSERRFFIMSFVFPVSLLLIMMIILAFLMTSTVKTEAAMTHTSHKYYTSVKIEQGDTLWSIAQENMTSEYSGIQEYIDEVCTLNHISEDDIHSGAYITIPYYSEDYLD
jgi:cell division protein YceG involved in septum cleavage